MAAFAGRPLLDHALDRIAAAGIETAVVNVCHYADQIERHLAARTQPKIVISDERGVLLETGGGPAGNNAVRHTYKWGVGPYTDGLFAQSNLGVVVKAGVWLMPAPEKFDFAARDFSLLSFIPCAPALAAPYSIATNSKSAADTVIAALEDAYRAGGGG